MVDYCAILVSYRTLLEGGGENFSVWYSKLDVCKACSRRGIWGQFLPILLWKFATQRFRIWAPTVYPNTCIQNGI